MATLYYTTIYLLYALGLAHCILTFKRYTKISEDAFWFMAAGISIMLAASINHANFRIENNWLSGLTIVVNIVLTAFSTSLSIVSPRIQIKVLSVFSGLILISSCVEKLM